MFSKSLPQTLSKSQVVAAREDNCDVDNNGNDVELDNGYEMSRVKTEVWQIERTI